MLMYELYDDEILLNERFVTMIDKLMNMNQQNERVDDEILLELYHKLKLENQGEIMIEKIRPCHLPPPLHVRP